MTCSLRRGSRQKSTNSLHLHLCLPNKWRMATGRYRTMGSSTLSAIITAYDSRAANTSTVVGWAVQTSRFVIRNATINGHIGHQQSTVIANDLYLDWIGHSTCNDGYIFSMVNVKLQNHSKYATMVTYCGAACMGGFEFSPLLHSCTYNYLSAHSIITKNTTTPAMIQSSVCA